MFSLKLNWLCKLVSEHTRLKADGVVVDDEIGRVLIVITLGIKQEIGPREET